MSAFHQFTRQLVFICLPLLSFAQDIQWTDVTSNHTLPEGIQVYKGTRSSPVLEVWYMDIDLNQEHLALLPYVGSSAKVPELSTRIGAYGAINGGFFGGSISYSSVVVPGEVHAKNVPTVTRNGKSYPVLRSMFAVDNTMKPSVDWIYHFGNAVEDIYRFDSPLPYTNNQTNPLSAPLASKGEPMNNLLLGIGGGPTLVKDSTISVTYDQEIFWGSGVGYDNRDPRSAIGYTADNHVILLVADGRQAQSQGLTMYGVANTLLSLGCIEAMNLDGGGSTGLAIGNSYINHPSEQRLVPSILAVVPRDSLQIPDPTAHELVIDTEDIGCSLEGEGWFTSANAGYWGNTPSVLNNVGSGDRLAKFNFIFDQAIDQAEVSAWWVAASNRSGDTPFIIHHTDGIDTVRRDQTQDHARWVSLGEYSFSAMTQHSIWVSNDATLGQYVVADAIRISSQDDLITVAISDPLSGSVNPKHAVLFGAYPNPFNPTTTISYGLPGKTEAKLTIYDISGGEVITFHDQDHSAGHHEVKWDGMDDLGNVVSTGVYFARLQAGDYRQTIKMVYLK